MVQINTANCHNSHYILCTNNAQQTPKQITKVTETASYFLYCYSFLNDLYLTSYPLLWFVSVPRFSCWLFSGGAHVGCSTLPWPRGAATERLHRLCWGLSGRLACGCGGSGFTIGRLLAQLEATGKLFMLKVNEGMKEWRFK